MSTGDLANLIARLEAVTNRLEKVSPGQSGPAMASASTSEEAAWVQEYSNVTSGPLNDFMAASESIGGLVKEQAQSLKAAIAAQLAYLRCASKSKKPSSTNASVIAELLQPTSQCITAIMELKEKNRRSEYFNHLSALAEGSAALAWVTMEPTPAPYIKDMADAGMFYVNRVLKDYKEKDAVHSQWTKALCSLWRELQAYVKQHHTTGLTWNPQGGDPLAATGAFAAAPAAPAAPAPPPPGVGAPPPPPPMGYEPSSTEKPSAEPDTSALFAEINKGGDITKGLKKVTDNMKTHKNPTLRAGPAPFKKPITAPKPGSASKPVAAPKAAAPTAKPPKVELQGKKWAVEYLTDNTNQTIEDVNPKQTVYIFKCTNAVIQIKGKVNSITLDNCKKTSVVFTDAISMVEFINCQSVKAQVLGVVPTVSIEKTDGCQIYLSKDSLNTSFITAKSSEMNVVIPTTDGDYAEYAIAEQFKTVFNGKTLVTEVNDIAA